MSVTTITEVKVGSLVIRERPPAAGGERQFRVHGLEAAVDWNVGHLVELVNSLHEAGFLPTAQPAPLLPDDGYPPL